MSFEYALMNLIFGFLIGLSLGLLGGGGSILTVPVLVYLAGQSPQTAITTSLAIVAANSTFGSFFHQRAGALNWPVALEFGSIGMVAAYLTAGLSKALSPALVMVLFAVLMLAIGSLMIFNRRIETIQEISQQRSIWVVLAAGLGVGMLTGLLGVGGGFLIVPALVFLVRLPMIQAVGTSLVIIAANSIAGFLGHLSDPIDFWVILVFAGAGVFGTYFGSQWNHQLPARKLRQYFGGFVFVLALFLLVDNLHKMFL